MLCCGIQHETTFTFTLVAAVGVDAAPVVARVGLFCTYTHIYTYIYTHTTIPLHIYWLIVNIYSTVRVLVRTLRYVVIQV